MMMEIREYCKNAHTWYLVRVRIKIEAIEEYKEFGQKKN